MCSTQTLEINSKNSWKKNKKILDGTDNSLDNDHPLIDSKLKDGNHPSKNQTAVDEEKLEKLNKKFGPINKNFVKDLKRRHWS